MKNALHLIGLLLLTLASCSKPQLPPLEEWHTHVEQGLTVKFPEQPVVLPQVVDSPLGELKFDIVTYELNPQSVFMALRLAYPVEPAQYDAEVGLEAAVQGAIDNVKGKLLSKDTITHRGLPGREFMISTSKGGYARCRVFIDPDGPTLYQVQAVGKRSFVDGSDAKAFLDSLAIQPISGS